MVFQDRRSFWREAFAWQGSITPLVIPYVLAFGLIATAICVLAWAGEHLYQVKIGLEIAPFEIAGAALGLLLILRTNAGYDRWWEAMFRQFQETAGAPMTFASSASAGPIRRRRRPFGFVSSPWTSGRPMRRTRRRLRRNRRRSDFTWFLVSLRFSSRGPWEFGSGGGERRYPRLTRMKMKKRVKFFRRVWDR